MVGLTVAGLDYLANCAVYVLDRHTGREESRSGIRPLHRPPFGEEPGDGAPVSYTHLTLPTILRV